MRAAPGPRPGAWCGALARQDAATAATGARIPMNTCRAPASASAPAGRRDSAGVPGPDAAAAGGGKVIQKLLLLATGAGAAPGAGQAGRVASPRPAWGAMAPRAGPGERRPGPSLSGNTCSPTWLDTPT